MQWTTKVFRLLGPRFLKLFFDAMKREYKAKDVAEFRAELGLGDYGNPMFEVNTRRFVSWHYSRKCSPRLNRIGRRKPKSPVLFLP